jgi:hypothetical protein
VTGTPSTTPSSPTARCSSRIPLASVSPPPWAWTRRCCVARAHGGASTGRLPSSTSPTAVCSTSSLVGRCRAVPVAGRSRRRVAGAHRLGDPRSLRPLPVGVRHDAARRHPDSQTAPVVQAMMTYAQGQQVGGVGSPAVLPVQDVVTCSQGLRAQRGTREPRSRSSTTTLVCSGTVRKARPTLTAYLPSPVWPRTRASQAT